MVAALKSALVAVIFLCFNFCSGQSSGVVHFYLGYYANYYTTKLSVTLTVSESHPVFYSIEIPGLGYSKKGVIAANDNVVINLPNNVVVSSIDDQNKGVYIMTNSSTMTVFGQNEKLGTSDTFLALPTSYLQCSEECVYYGISVARSVTERNSDQHQSSILIVGIENSTVMNLTVTKSVKLRVSDTTYDLTPGTQYTFVINWLQTILIRSLEDLTGTKIATDKSVSVFSGHQCAIMKQGDGLCDHIVEQIPPTTSWGKVFFIAPLATRKSFTIKVLATNTSTIVDIYCNNSKTSYSLNAGGVVLRKYIHQEYCSIHSNKKIFVAQFSHGPDDDSTNGDVMMTMIPAVSHYTNQFSASTIQNPQQSGYNHYVNIIVLAQYYKPDMIYLISGGVNKSLYTQEWVPVKVNNVTEAYATKVTISEGVFEVIHTNTLALMTTIVYGFTTEVGYGHPGGLSLCKELFPSICLSSMSNEIVLSTNNYNLSLTCEADGATSYNWERNGSNIPPGAIGVNTSTLTIINLQPEDAGNYRCVASSEDPCLLSNYTSIKFNVCGPLTAPDNGTIDCSLGSDGIANPGDTCTFTCDDGLELRGSATRECQYQRRKGTLWSGNEVRCVLGRVCSTLMAPVNGTIDCSLGDDGGATNGDTCTVTCNDGFTLRGDATRKCRITRRGIRWRGTKARCIKVTRPSCDPLSAPDNGMIDCSLGGDGVPTNGDICRFACNDGFELSGSQSRRCRIRNNRGRWTGNQATCNMGCIDIGNITAQTITGGDGATVIFSSHQDATFTCQLDSGTAVTCTSPQVYSGLSAGSHSITLVSTCPGETKGISNTSTFRIRSPV